MTPVVSAPRTRAAANLPKEEEKGIQGLFLLPIFFGMAVAFVIGAAILIYLIFTNSSNLLFSNRADVQVISFVGMTKDEFLATDYNNLLRAEFPEEYSSEPAGTIIRQTPRPGVPSRKSSASC